MEHYSKIRLIAMTDSVITDVDRIQRLGSEPFSLEGIEAATVDKLAGNVLVLAIVVKEMLRREE